MAGVLKDQWIPYLKEVFRVLKPGIGWVQCTEFAGHRFISESGTIPDNCALREVYNH
jgi:hypothetical protein